ncbi:hypothetical protein JXM83_04180 [Candidatus Woesearchaeota archaeon]|nr:hypothetical protein [Candidatus Woesearchaeota archaeon]
MKLKLNLIIICMFLMVGIVQGASDYYIEKSYTSGSSVSIANQDYKLYVGNQGQKIKLEGPTSFEISLSTCKTRNNTNICYLLNESETKAKISIAKYHGILTETFTKNYVGNDLKLLEGGIVELNFTFENTGNVSIQPTFSQDISDYFYILDYENCIISNGDIIFNETIEPEENVEFWYRLQPKNSFKKKEITPKLNYYNGVKYEEIKLDKQTYEVTESIDLDVFVNKNGVELGDLFNVTIYLNNTQEVAYLNYSFEIIVPEDSYEITSTYKMLKGRESNIRQAKGVLKNITAINRIVEVKTLTTKPENISVLVEIMDGSTIDFEKKYNISTQVFFTKEPQITLKMREFVIGGSNETLQIFLENMADFPIENISTMVVSKIINGTYKYDKVDELEEIAEIELPNDISGKHNIQFIINYQTSNGDKFTKIIDKKLSFPNNANDKVTLEDQTETINETKTATELAQEILNNINTTTNITEEEQSQDEEVIITPDNKNNTLLLIGLGALPIMILFLIVIYNKIFKLSNIRKKEEEIISEINKIQKQLEKRGK